MESSNDAGDFVAFGSVLSTIKKEAKKLGRLLWDYDGYMAERGYMQYISTASTAALVASPVYNATRQITQGPQNDVAMRDQGQLPATPDGQNDFMVSTRTAAAAADESEASNSEVEPAGTADEAGNNDPSIRPEDDMPSLIDDGTDDGMSSTSSAQDSMPGLIRDGIDEIISDDWEGSAAGEHEAGGHEAGVGSGSHIKHVRGSNIKHTRGRGSGKGFLRLAAKLGVGVLVVAGAVLGAQHMAKRRENGASSMRR